MLTEQLSQALSIAAAPVHPQSVAVGTAATGGIDMSHFRRAIFLLDVGAFGASATVDMKLQQAPDNVTFTDVPSGAITELNAAGGNNRLATLEIRDDELSAGNRYVRALVTVGTAATTLGCLALGGEAVDKPGSANDIAAVAQRLVV